MSPTIHKPNVALIGMGLIGSSLGHALKKHDLTAHISGYARSAQTREAAMDIGFVDSVHETPEAACIDADVVFFNTPLSAVKELAEQIIPGLKDNAILTDVGSVKAGVLKDISPLLEGRVHFVPGHPIAGTEESGPRAGFAELFEERWCILTPDDKTSLLAVEQISKLWQGMGSEVTFMDAAHHDLVLAITSHLPHLIAFNIVGTAAQLESDTRSEVIKYSASGFRDFTRIAASDPIMWRDIFIENKDAVLEVLGRFSEDLTALQRAIRHSDAAYLEDVFTRTRGIRQSIIEAGQDTEAPNFGRDS
ncbi:MAG: prephenate/arogenate dehydrogenase family protein [Rhodobiaceae bacterium]|jgi:cyclohexadieny/prephenate dehydrogenase|nr:prephenate/arogenate dehydrogenase family protein [Rhodobiaceae bacterium]MBT7279542.1 prephenate/arogenate dehydrogenase family protein [Rhodobiaceae bacterium]